jgi:hypothetical protein
LSAFWAKFSLTKEAVNALKQGFAEQLNITLEVMPLTEKELALADKLRAEQYANEAVVKTGLIRRGEETKTRRFFFASSPLRLIASV